MKQNMARQRNHGRGNLQVSWVDLRMARGCVWALQGSVHAEWKGCVPFLRFERFVTLTIAHQHAWLASEVPPKLASKVNRQGLEAMTPVLKNRLMSGAVT